MKLQADASGLMGLKELVKLGSAENTHALVELVSSCCSEYDNFGVLEVDREGDPVFADSSSEKTLDALMGFTSPLKGSIAISLIALRIRCLSSAGNPSISLNTFLWMRMLKIGLWLV